VSLGGPFSVAGAAKPPADPAAMENAWDMVWWRRLAYFTTLALTAFVGLFALLIVCPWPKRILHVTEDALKHVCLSIIGLLARFYRIQSPMAGIRP
jgi:hypothetical protein